MDETSPVQADSSKELSVQDVAAGLAQFIGGIPAYLHKNVAKALQQIYTLTLAYPTARINNVIAENNAASLERQKLTKLSGKQIAAKMQTDDQFARDAAEKFARKILRESVNLNKIADVAIKDLAKEAEAGIPLNNTEIPELSEDWLNAFQNEGGSLSSEQMQRLFGKILSGEIRKPGSYSIRTLRLMAQLDNSAAQIFARFCSLSSSLHIPAESQIIDARVISMGNAAANSLAEFGLSFDQLNLLLEHGLIISDFNSYREYNVSIAINDKVMLPVTHSNQLYGFVSKNEGNSPSPLQIHGVAFSQAGKELLRIVDIVPDQNYTNAVSAFFETQGYIFTRISSQ